MKAPILLVLLLLSGAACAQDIDPFFGTRVRMLMDPSRTGAQTGGQVSLVHNEQWLQLPGAWRSDLLAAELALRNNKRARHSWLGIGLVAMNDRTNAGRTRVAAVGLTPSVHVRSGRHSRLSFGLELRWMNGRSGGAEGTWASQYDGNRFDPSTPSGETWNTTRSTWAEARSGLSWSLQRSHGSARQQERDVLVIGASADHLGHFLLRADGTVPEGPPLRITAYAIGEMPHEIWDDGYFSAEVVGHLQGPFRTGRLNVFAGKHAPGVAGTEERPKGIGFKVGAGYRYRDALVASAAIDHGLLSFGLAYGWASTGRGAPTSGRRTMEAMLQVRF